jgi:alpha-glucosidase
MSPYRELLTTYSADRPEVHEIVEHMRRVIEDYDDRMLVGEIYLPVERLVTYYGASGKGAHLPFNFQLIALPWQARAITAAIERYYALLPANAWPNWVLGNHDKPRIASRVGSAQARVAAMLLLTLRGTPTLYYGDEIGMEDVPIAASLVRDPYEKNVPGLGLGRDPERTPMQWDGNVHAGFSNAHPWLPISANYHTVNVAAQSREPGSLLNLYRSLIDLRRRETALSVGELAPLPAEENIVAYMRKADARRFLVVLNFAASPERFALSELRSAARIVLSTNLDRLKEQSQDCLELRSNEGVICELS